MSGFYILDRDFWTDNTFADEPFTEREAWHWLIAHANYEPRRQRVGSRLIQIERGQLAVSVHSLAGIFRWSRGKLRNYLRILSDDGKLSLHSNPQITIITVCNYDKFQDRAKTPSPRQAHAKPTPSPRAVPPYKEKEIKEVKEAILLGARENFSEFDESNDAPASEEHSELSEVPGVTPYTGGAPHTQPTPLAAAETPFKRLQAWIEARIPEAGVNCWVLAPLHSWLASGADPDMDIIPTIDRLVALAEAKGKRIGGLQYFSNAIAQSIAERTARLPDARAASPPIVIRMTDTFTPGEDWLDEARSRGLSESEAGKEWGKFKDWHLARGISLVDWKAQWRNWIRTAVEKSQQYGRH